jgi:hypothetical protein
LLNEAYDSGRHKQTWTYAALYTLRFFYRKTFIRIVDVTIQSYKTSVDENILID